MATRTDLLTLGQTVGNLGFGRGMQVTRRLAAQGALDVLGIGQPKVESVVPTAQAERISELDLRLKRKAALLRRNQLGQTSLLSGGSTGLSETLG